MLTQRLRLAFMVVLVLVPVACILPPSVSDLPIPPPGAVSEAELGAVEGVNTFAADLYAQLRERDGNLLVSPYSINTALAMTAAGAQETTRTQMEQVLHLPPGDQLAPGYRAMTARVAQPAQAATHKSELSVANALWVQSGHPWRKEYLKLVRDDFRAGLFDADFADAGTASRRINTWVAKETHEHVRNLVPASALGHATRIVLANAIYFKAGWATPFKKENTQPADFTLNDGKKIRTPLMFQQNNFLLREEDTLQLLRLPYDGGDTSMYVLLPRKTDGLIALEEGLTPETLRKWTSDPANAPLVEVKVWLPKFRFTVPTELAGALQKMGMTEPFSKGANFGGMTDHPIGVVISRVLHKAFVELDETGTEAAAATAAVGLTMSAQPMAAPVKEFRADHPFLFVIKHEPTGVVLFLGRVLDPARWDGSR